MTRTGLIAGLAITALANSAVAQDALITGTVRSARANQRLQAANVRIQSMDVTVGTDSAGFFRISVPSYKVRDQTVIISARAIGFKPQQKEITLMAGQQRHDFTLEGDSTRVSEVVVIPRSSPGEKQLTYTVQRADTARNPSMQGSNSSFSQHLFAPELIMQNQSRLRITEPQREVILQEITKVQTAATQAQWRVSDEAEKLNDLLSREGASEADILAQAERMMNWEEAVKRAQLSMLLRIRNVLTAEQRTMLRELRRRD